MKNIRFVSPVLMWLIVIVGIIVIFNVFPSNNLFSRNYLTFILFLIFFIYWIFFFSWSIRFHKKAPLSTFKISKLIKNGPYKIVRHPIYSADIILGFGILLLFPTSIVFLSLLWLVFVLLFWMRLEEKSLIEKFGLEYRIYIAKTPMFIPNFKMQGGRK